MLTVLELGQRYLRTGFDSNQSCTSALTGASALIQAASGIDKCDQGSPATITAVCVQKTVAESNNHEHSGDQPPHLDPICLSSMMSEPNANSSRSNAASEGWRCSLLSDLSQRLQNKAVFGASLTVQPPDLSVEQQVRMLIPARCRQGRAAWLYIAASFNQSQDDFSSLSWAFVPLCG